LIYALKKIFVRYINNSIILYRYWLQSKFVIFNDYF